MKLIKRFVIYFLIINFFIFGLRFFYPNKIVFGVESSKHDFIQIFFKHNGKYSEQNSLSSNLIKSGEVTFELPFGNLEENLIRIDPLNSEGEILINKIAIYGLFYSKVFSIEDVKSNIKPVQMINKIYSDNGIQINSLGNDPVFELYNADIFNNQNKIQFIFGLIISLILIFFNINTLISKVKFYFEKFYEEVCFYNEKYPYITVSLLALIATLFIITIFYPGFMSYDTLHALRGARNGVIDSMWPPMVSYIWRFIDLFSTNPSLMHFVQVYILFFSISYLIYFKTRKILLVLIALILCLIIPVLIGTLAVIWKDVLMASLFLLSFSIFLFAKNTRIDSTVLLLNLVGFLFVFIAICVRHNAIVAAVPLLVYSIYSLLIHFRYKKNILLVSILLGIFLSFGLYSIKKQLDKYSLPDFVEMKSSESDFIVSVRVLDIAGASICSTKNLFHEILPNLTVEEIKKIYDPRHINLSKKMLEKVPLDSNINDIWLSTLFHHPFCIMYNKFELTKYMIGLHSGQQFLITDPSVIDNEYGYKLNESKMRNKYVDFIVKYSEFFMLKPWFLYILGLLFVGYLILIKKMNIEISVLLLSALFYLGGLIVFGNAADARLPFYTNIIFIVIIILSSHEIKIYKKELKR